MMRFEDLSHNQLDVLKEIGNIGAGHAATALSQLLAEKVEMTVPDVSIIPLNKVSEVLGGAENLVVGVYMRVFGDAPGKIIFIFSDGEAKTLAAQVLNRNTEAVRDFGEMEISALKEIGNIMTGAYLYALTNFTKINYFSTVPAFARDMAGAILNTAITDLGVLGEYALLIETQFSLVRREINGHFFLIPDPGALEKILSALGVDTSCRKP